MKIKHGFKYKQNGWTYISIKGEPYERGFAHGTLLKDEIKKCLATMEWNLYDSHGLKIDFFKEISNFFFKKTIEVNFPELFAELKGIAKGAVVNLDELILWNNLASMDYALPKLKIYLDEMPHLKSKYGHLLETLPSVGQLEGGSKDKCSAFMALGDYTIDGKICCAHNSFDNFIDGQNFNIILDMKPSKGIVCYFNVPLAIFLVRPIFLLIVKDLSVQKQLLVVSMLINMGTRLLVELDIVCNTPIL